MTGLDVEDTAAKADNMVNPAFLAASMIDERAPDIVEALNDMPPGFAAAVLLHLPPDRAIGVLDQPGLERTPELVTLMPREAAAKLLAGVSADRVTDIFRQVKEPHRSELLELLDPDTRVNIRRLLEYPKDTAGSIMTTESQAFHRPTPSSRHFTISVTSKAAGKPSTRSTCWIHSARS